jgi:benzoate/toluate 1,2-dioxygenase alpha subunit
MRKSNIDVKSLRQLQNELPGWLVSDDAKGEHRIARRVFMDPAVFELEMLYIFERNWVYLAHESQLDEPGAFFTTFIGRQPVIVTRDKSGEINCIVNACSHRGAKVCREKKGNRKSFTCSFHGWVYDNRGELLDVRSEAQGSYPDNFEHDRYNLPRARVSTYRGFVFASLQHDIAPLEEMLGGAKAFIDIFVDQSVSGALEVIRGTASYTYRGNWKLAIENGVDGYHGPTVHASFVELMIKRQAGASKGSVVGLDLSKIETTKGGYFYFGNGSAIQWSEYLNYQAKPNFPHFDTYTERFGSEKAAWIMKRNKNLLLFPNVFFMDASSTQIRVVRPVSVDVTEVTTYCIAPKGESAQARERRIRQYEDFYNATGMATPDDLAEFNACQAGFSAGASAWSDLSRGAKERSDNLEYREQAEPVEAVYAGTHTTNEGIFVGIHEGWRARLEMAISAELEGDE